MHNYLSFAMVNLKVAFKMQNLSRALAVLIAICSLSIALFLPIVTHAAPAELIERSKILELLNARYSQVDQDSQALHADHVQKVQSAQEGRALGNIFNMTGDGPASIYLENPFQAIQGPNPSDLGFVVTRRLLGGPAVQSLSFLNSSIQDVPPEALAPTALASVLGLLSYVGVFLVSIFVSYTFIGGILSQGKDGEFLGRNWDSLFVPLRTAIGSIGTYPVPFFGGLSVIQMMVLTVFLVGLGAGSALFASAAPILMTQPIISAQFEPNKVKELTDAIADMQVCGMTQLHETDTPLPEGQRWAISENNYRRILHYNVDNWRSCGYIKASVALAFEPTESRLGTFAQRVLVNDLTMFVGGLVTGGEFEGGFTNDGQITGYIKAHLREAIFVEALPELFEDIEPLTMLAWHAETMAQEHDNILGGFSHDETISYLQKMAGGLYWQSMDAFELRSNQLVTTVMNNTEFIKNHNDFFQETVESQGMLFGGAYYYLMSRRQNAMAQALEGSLPTVTPINLTALQNASWLARTWDRARRFLRNMGGDRERMTSAKLVFNQFISAAPEFTPDYSRSLRKLNQLSSGDITPLAGAGAAIAEVITAVPRIGENSSAINPDPILEMQSMGTKILQAMFLLDVFPDSSLDGEGGGGEGGKGSKFASKVISLALYGLTAVAFLYSTIIPSLPYVIYTISALGLFIFLIKALVVANIWWAMMAHPDGQDLIGRSGPGYQMMLSLLLRPILMVVGLIAAIAIIRISAYVINITLFPTIQLMNDGFTNPIGMANYFVVYGILMLVVTYKNIGLVYELPQAVLQFLGVGNAYTDFGEKEAQMKVAGLGMLAQKLQTGSRE